MILDLAPILHGLLAALPRLGLVVGLVGALAVLVRLVPIVRQRAYDRAAANERVRLLIATPAGLDPNPELAVGLIRGLHPRQRRGLDAWQVGWPSADLRVVWRDGALAWEIDTNRQVAALAAAQLRALYPGVQVDE